MDKFCSECGAAMRDQVISGRARRRCPQCGHIVFGHYSLGVGGLLIHQGRILLVQRAQPPDPGYWSIPSGFVEIDEPPDQAAVREVFEETGLRTRATGLLTCAFFPGPPTHNAFFIFSLELEGPPEALKPNGDGEETLQAGFFALEQVASLGKVWPLSLWLSGQTRASEAVMFRVLQDGPIRERMRNQGVVVYGPRWLDLDQ
ncbi:MAG: NUDIX domain-containing protein [Chloroflexota bacterium]